MSNKESTSVNSGIDETVKKDRYTQKKEMYHRTVYRKGTFNPRFLLWNELGKHFIDDLSNSTV